MGRGVGWWRGEGCRGGGKGMNMRGWGWSVKHKDLPKVCFEDIPITDLVFLLYMEEYK